MSYSRLPALGLFSTGDVIARNQGFQARYDLTVSQMVDAGRQAYDQAERERKVRAAGDRLRDEAMHKAADVLLAATSGLSGDYGLGVDSKKTAVKVASMATLKGATAVTGADPETIKACTGKYGGTADTKTCVKGAATIAATKGCNAAAAAFTGGAGLAISAPVCSKLGAIAASIVAEPLANIINGVGKAIGIGSEGPRCSPDWDSMFASYCSNTQKVAGELTKGINNFYDTARSLLGLDANMPISKLAWAIDPGLAGQYFADTRNIQEFEFQTINLQVIRKILDRNMPSMRAEYPPDAKHPNWHTEDVPNPSGFDISPTACMGYMNAVAGVLRYNRHYPCDWQSDWIAKKLYDAQPASARNAYNAVYPPQNNWGLDAPGKLPAGSGLTAANSHLGVASQALHHQLVDARNTIAANWIAGYTATLIEINSWLIAELSEQTEEQVQKALDKLKGSPFLPKPQAVMFDASKVAKPKTVVRKTTALAKPIAKKGVSPAIPVLMLVGFAAIGMIVFRKKIKAWKLKRKASKGRR
jgi:hypothetical protein